MQDVHEWDLKNHCTQILGLARWLAYHGSLPLESTTSWKNNLSTKVRGHNMNGNMGSLERKSCPPLANSLEFGCFWGGLCCGQYEWKQMVSPLITTGWTCKKFNIWSGNGFLGIIGTCGCHLQKKKGQGYYLQEHTWGLMLGMEQTSLPLRQNQNYALEYQSTLCWQSQPFLGCIQIGVCHNSTGCTQESLPHSFKWVLDEWWLYNSFGHWNKHLQLSTKLINVM